MLLDDYLYEIIDDYKNASSTEEKNEIFNLFCSSIWGSKNKRRVYNKQIKFKVRSDLLDTEIGQIFNTWSEVDYVGYKAMTKDTDWCSLIRQKINNLYTRYCDKEVILKKDYMDLLKIPYNLYYRWIKGAEINPIELTDLIETSIYKAIELKSIYQKQKMDKSWNEYKVKIEEFLLRAFDNCKLIENYEQENLTDKYIYEFALEDNFYISYICNCLEGEMLNWQKDVNELKRGRNKKYKNCMECGKMIEIKSKKDYSTKYCDECKEKIRKEKRIKYNSDYYNKHIKNKAKIANTTII